MNEMFISVWVISVITLPRIYRLSLHVGSLYSPLVRKPTSAAERWEATRNIKKTEVFTVTV
jgi:hypothetical protein